MGYETAIVKVSAISESEAAVKIAMRTSTQLLSTVTIAGRRVTFPVRFADAYTRASRSTGAFFTREKIDSLKPLDIKALLQTLPAVLVNDRGITFQRCQSGLVGPLGDGSLTLRHAVMDRPPDSDQSGPNPAHVQVYVDGNRRTRYNSSSPQFQLDAEHGIRDINPAAIQIMEVYTGVGRIPGEYLDDACAVILIWTKSY